MGEPCLNDTPQPAHPWGMRQYNSPLTNRSVVIVGGTGTFGKAFARRALDVGASRVGIFSRDELKQSDMRATFNDDRLRFMIGSVTDSSRVARALRGADIVVNAAALKQVPACESNPSEAKRTNTDGAEIVAAAAIDAGVWRGVYLSTDKACAANTFYGSTKAAGERLWIQSNVYAAGTRTRLVATRYGNVIGSRGSVIPKWQQQAANGEPLTITDPGMTRFWMTIDQAVLLVERAIRDGRGGEVFIPRIPSCTMAVVSEAIAPESDQTHIPVRPGEKLHEMLVSEDEAHRTFNCGDHFRIEPDRTWEYLPPLGWPTMPQGWSYRSDTNPQKLTIPEMRTLIYGDNDGEDA